jgi:hypothetical protein
MTIDSRQMTTVEMPVYYTAIGDLSVDKMTKHINCSKMPWTK